MSDRRLAPGGVVAVYLAVLLGLTLAGAGVLPAHAASGDAVDRAQAAMTALGAACGVGLAFVPLEAFDDTGRAILLAIAQVGGLTTLIIGGNLVLRLLTGKPVGWLASAAGVLTVALAAEGIGFAALVVLGHDPSTALHEAVAAFTHWGRRAPEAAGSAASGGATFFVLLPLVLIASLGWPVWRGLTRRAGDDDPVRQYARAMVAATAAVIVVGFLLLPIPQVVPAAYRSLGIGQTAGNEPLEIDGDLMLQISSRSMRWAVASRSAGGEQFGLAAGFSEVRPAAARDGVYVIVLAMMLLGGCAGSAAGGLTLGWLALLVIGLKTGGWVERRSVWLLLAWPAVLAAAVFVGLLALSLAESQRFEQRLFAVVAAVTGSGVTLGGTASFSRGAGYPTFAALMLVGRVAPIWLLSRVKRPTGAGTL